MDVADYMLGLGKNARAAAREVARSSSAARNLALRAMADELLRQSDSVLVANEADVAAARDQGLEPALLDRLGLSAMSVTAMAEGLRQIAELSDPVGEISELRRRPSGIQVGRMRVPLGVIGIIYESRPDVTADAAGLCLKSGNAAILRGGSEAMRSNQVIAACVQAGLQAAGLPASAVQVVETTDRAAVGALIRLREWVDVIVPRGGRGLIERISAEAAIPVIKHLDGICHVYVHTGADLAMALAIANNAKTQRYGTCNTMETLLVDAAIAPAFLPEIDRVYAAKQVAMRACPRALALLREAGVEGVTPAEAADWSTEYLAPIVAIAVVDGLDAAIDHIETYGSHHTDAIVTNHYGAAQRFLREVDSASVMVNASTRFADGFEYGLGAEIGISTDKLHARGPVGLEGLTGQKWIVLGDGEVRG